MSFNEVVGPIYPVWVVSEGKEDFIDETMVGFCILEVDFLSSESVSFFLVTDLVVRVHKDFGDFIIVYEVEEGFYCWDEIFWEVFECVSDECCRIRVVCAEYHVFSFYVIIVIHCELIVEVSGEFSFQDFVLSFYSKTFLVKVEVRVVGR